MGGKTVWISDIRAVVAARYGLKPSDLTSQSRRRKIAHPRQIAMYLARKMTRRSLPAIGNAFGGRDHTTVLHARECVKARMKARPEFAVKISEMERDIRARAETAVRYVHDVNAKPLVTVKGFRTVTVTTTVPATYPAYLLAYRAKSPVIRWNGEART